MRYSLFSRFMMCEIASHFLRKLVCSRLEQRTRLRFSASKLMKRYDLSPASSVYSMPRSPSLR